MGAGSRRSPRQSQKHSRRCRPRFEECKNRQSRKGFRRARPPRHRPAPDQYFAEELRGYAQIVPSHLAAATAVANQQADCCIATVSAARCLGLDFIPLSRERFDLIVDSAEVDTAGIRFMFDVLNRASLRRELVSLAGYEVRHTGALLM